MNKKTVILLVVIAIVVFVAGFLLGSGRAHAPAAAPASSTVAATLPLTIFADHDASAPLYKLTIEYPKFPSIADWVNSHLADFKQLTKENWAARAATAPSGTAPQAPEQIYYFNVSWQPAQLNAHYESVIVRLAEFVGGANENQEIMTYNYDLQKKAPVTLADLFPSDPNYLMTISSLARQELTDSLNNASNGHVDPSMLADGTAPTADNFKDFTFDDDVITFYFPKYQVAPGVFGEQRVTISRS